MLDEMVVGIARKGQRVEPESVDDPFPKGGEPRPMGHQVRQIVAQDVMPDKVASLAAERLQPVEGRAKLSSAITRDVGAPLPHSRESKQPGGMGIDFQVNGHAVRKKIS